MEQGNTRRRRSGEKSRTSKAAMDAEARRQAQRAAAAPTKRKRKKKRKAPRVKNRRFWKDLFIMLAVTAAVILSLSIFFKVKTVEVTGNSYYTPEQIIDASGVETGDNLLALSKATIAGRIRAELPYVREVQIRRSLPDRLVVAIKEFDVCYAVQDTSGGYWLMTAAGGLLEQVDKKTAGDYLQVTGFTVKDPVAGTQIELAPAEQGESTATQKEAVITLLTLLEQSEVGDHVASVDVPSSYDISFWYGDQYLVQLGTTQELEYKLQYLAEVIRRLDSYTTGQIDLTFTSENKAIFRAFE